MHKTSARDRLIIWKLFLGKYKEAARNLSVDHLVLRRMRQVVIDTYREYSQDYRANHPVLNEMREVAKSAGVEIIDIDPTVTPQLEKPFG